MIINITEKIVKKRDASMIATGPETAIMESASVWRVTPERTATSSYAKIIALTAGFVTTEHVSVMKGLQECFAKKVKKNFRNKKQ